MSEFFDGCDDMSSCRGDGPAASFLKPKHLLIRASQTKPGIIEEYMCLVQTATSAQDSTCLVS